MTRLFVPLFVVAVVGCADDATDPLGFQVGGEGSFGCEILSIADVTDPSAPIEALGQSADEALAGFDGTFVGTGTTADGQTVDPLTLVVAAPTHHQWIETGHDGAPSDSCLPYLAADTTVDVDGGSTIGGSLTGWISVASATNVLLRASTPMEEATGSLEPLYADPETLAQVDLDLIAERVDGGWAGALGFAGCTEDGVCSPPVSPGADPELAFEVGS